MEKRSLTLFESKVIRSIWDEEIEECLQKLEKNVKH